MPSSNERRLINWFVHGYNTCNTPKITAVNADRIQEAPDAICSLENNQQIALELTTLGAPKGTFARYTSQHERDLPSLVKLMQRKLNNDYRVSGINEVWLLIHLRLTLPWTEVEETVSNIQIPSRFNKVYLQWPLPIKTDQTSVSVLELPNHRFWSPNIPRSIRRPKSQFVAI